MPTRNSRAAPAGTVPAPVIVLAGPIGCRDGAVMVALSPPGETVLAGKGNTGSTSTAVAIEDALSRILPALEAGGSVTALHAGLNQVLVSLQGGNDKTGLTRALSELQDAVTRYRERAGLEYLPDLDALRLALLAAAG